MLRYRMKTKVGDGGEMEELPRARLYDLTGQHTNQVSLGESQQPGTAFRMWSNRTEVSFANQRLVKKGRNRFG